jgi:hypothetical protein
MNRFAWVSVSVALITVVVVVGVWQVARSPTLSVSEVRARCAAHPHLRLSRPIVVRGTIEFGSENVPLGGPYQIGDVCSAPNGASGVARCLALYAPANARDPANGLYGTSATIVTRGELVCDGQHMYTPALVNVSRISRPGLFGVVWSL